MCRKRGLRALLIHCEMITRLFDMLRENYALFDVSREIDPRTSSGKFLRVKRRYPECFRFLGLCCMNVPEINTHYCVVGCR